MITIMRGLPACGKTTKALELVKVQRAKRVNRDELRRMIDGGVYSKTNEQEIVATEKLLVTHYVTEHYNVVIDDTNLNPKVMQMWLDLAKSLGVKAEVCDLTDVPLEECLKRDQKRANYVGEKVILRMYRDYLAPERPVVPYIHALPDAVIVDVDGTLAIKGKRSPYDWKRVGEDQPDEAIADLVKLLNRYGQYHIIVVSGRMDECYDLTHDWLILHNIPFDTLLMRKSGDMRGDDVVKAEIYEQHIKGKYNIMYVLDDRDRVVRFWRSLGLKTLQVADGDF